MKTILKAAAVAAFAVSTMSGAALAQNMGDMMMSKAQCSAMCNSEYMQCVMASQQMTSDPMMALEQVRMNFSNATACGQAAMQCQQGC